MNNHHDDPLLTDVLNEGADAAVAAASLEKLLSANRRVRRQRRIFRGAAVCTLVLMGIGLSSLYLRREPHTDSAITSAPRQGPNAAPLHELTDEELFALFPDRQMALIGPPGDQRLVFVDGR
jgi:hypothetical protein